MDPKLHGVVETAFQRLDYDTAAAALLKMPPSAKRDVRLAHAYRYLGRLDLSREYLEPHHTQRNDAAFEYGMVQLGYGALVEAWEHFECSVELGPSADALNGLAFLEELHSRGANRDKLYSFFEHGFALDANHPGLLQTFGIAQLNDGKAVEALQTFHHVLAHWSKEGRSGSDPHFDAHCNMACALTTLGWSSEALDHIEAALESTPRKSRTRRAMGICGHADLAALQAYERFWEILGDSPFLQRAASAPASPLFATIAIADVKVFSQSAQHHQVESACRVLAGLVEDRHEAFDDIDNGVAPDRELIKTSERLIVECLGEPDWLVDHLRAAMVPVEGLKLLAQLLAGYCFGAFDDPLSELQVGVARRLVPEALTRWVHEPGERFPAQEILEGLACADEEALSAEVSRVLTDCLAEDLPAANRKWVLAAVQAQTTSEQASTLTALVTSANVDEVCAGLVASIRVARENVDWLHWFNRSEATIRELIAIEFTAELGDTRLFGLWDESDGDAKNRLIKSFLVALGPNFAPRAVEYCRTGKYLRETLRWLQEQRLRDEDILLFATLRPSAMTGNAPIRTRNSMSVEVLRGHQRRLSCSGEEAGLGDESTSPTVFTASVVGYLGVCERVQWLRDYFPQADQLTTSAIVRAIGMVGDSSDLTLLRDLGESNPGMLEDTRVARMLLGDSCSEVTTEIDPEDS